MSYDYENEKPEVLKPDGQKMLFKIKTQVDSLLEASGAVRLEKAVSGVSGNSWTSMACLDYLVELGYLKEVTAGMDVIGQHRIFVKANR